MNQSNGANFHDREVWNLSLWIDQAIKLANWFRRSVKTIFYDEFAEYTPLQAHCGEFVATSVAQDHVEAR